MPKNDKEVEDAFIKTFRPHRLGVTYQFDSGNTYSFCEVCKQQYYLKIVDRRPRSSVIERNTTEPCPGKPPE